MKAACCEAPRTVVAVSGDVAVGGAGEVATGSAAVPGNSAEELTARARPDAAGVAPGRGGAPGKALGTAGAPADVFMELLGDCAGEAFLDCRKPCPWRFRMGLLERAGPAGGSQGARGDSNRVSSKRTLLESGGRLEYFIWGVAPPCRSPRAGDRASVSPEAGKLPWAGSCGSCGKPKLRRERCCMDWARGRGHKLVALWDLTGNVALAVPLHIWLSVADAE